MSSFYRTDVLPVAQPTASKMHLHLALLQYTAGIRVYQTFNLSIKYNYSRSFKPKKFDILWQILVNLRQSSYYK